MWMTPGNGRERHALERGAQRTNDTNAIGDRPMKQTSGDRGRQTLNSGGRVPAGLDPDLNSKATHVAALAICTHCDGTGWTHTATKGLTRCTQQTGQPHDN